MQGRNIYEPPAESRWNIFSGACRNCATWGDQDFREFSSWEWTTSLLCHCRNPHRSRTSTNGSRKDPGRAIQRVAPARPEFCPTNQKINNKKVTVDEQQREATLCGLTWASEEPAFRLIPFPFGRQVARELSGLSFCLIQIPGLSGTEIPDREPGIIAAGSVSRSPLASLANYGR
jgi:hypothetical protein